MIKPKIFHEGPLCLMDKIQQYTDGDYCLPHLMDQNEEYKNFFLKAKENNRYILLDNSLHELSHPYSEDRLFHWLNVLQPNEFFVPDFWEDKTQSIVSAKKWITAQDTYDNTTFIAVVQAKSIGDAIICYQTYKDLGYRKIAFSYGAEYYNEWSFHPNKSFQKAIGRVNVIQEMEKLGIIAKNDRIHLLGTSSPTEFGFYKDCPYIESIDTSNPVMAAIEGLKYVKEGIHSKPTVNMNSCFNIKIEDIDLELLEHNVKMFRTINNL